jgi:hypothetical protein
VPPLRGCDCLGSAITNHKLTTGGVYEAHLKTPQPFIGSLSEESIAHKCNHKFGRRRPGSRDPEPQHRGVPYEPVPRLPLKFRNKANHREVAFVAALVSDIVERSSLHLTSPFAIFRFYSTVIQN